MQDDVSERPLFFPSPPPDGGFLVLTKHQYENAELRALVREIYPQTRVLLQRSISR